MITSIIEKAEKGILLTKEDAVELLQVDNHSLDFYQLIAAAALRSRKQFENKGYVFAQIGINGAPCTGNCGFCSLAKDYFSLDTAFEMSEKEVLDMVLAIDFRPLEALFLMTTADYSQEKFLKIGRAVKSALPEGIQFIANVGDFDLAYAKKLKTVGFTGVYHIVRLREGTDTDIPKAQRIKTLDAARDAGLEIYYCVEPIGPEHTPEELADEMLRARDYQVDVMAVMARIGVPGTKFFGKPEISELDITKIAAVTRLVTDPKKSMNVHEPKKMPLLAGVNQLYAEIGVNPRDTKADTQNGRGFTVPCVVRMLEDSEYTVAK